MNDLPYPIGQKLRVKTCKYYEGCEGYLRGYFGPSQEMVILSEHNELGGGKRFMALLNNVEPIGENNAPDGVATDSAMFIN